MLLKLAFLRTCKMEQNAQDWMRAIMQKEGQLISIDAHIFNFIISNIFLQIKYSLCFVLLIVFRFIYRRYITVYFLILHLL